MITIKDFDDIVLNNPFLTGNVVGYGVHNLQIQANINYSPDSLHLYGQSNSTCKYITIKHAKSGKEYKFVREDDHIDVVDLTTKNYQLITDIKLLTDVKNVFTEFKTIVFNQINNYEAIMQFIQNNKFNFHLEETRKFINLLYPSISDKNQDNIIRVLKRVEKNPAKYLEDPVDSIGFDAKNIVQSVFFSILTDKLSKINTLHIVDSNSHFEEIKDILSPLFQELQIPTDVWLKKEITTVSAFLTYLATVLFENNYLIYDLANDTDTYLLIYTKTENSNELEKLATIMNLHIKKMK